MADQIFGAGAPQQLKVVAGSTPQLNPVTGKPLAPKPVQFPDGINASLKKAAAVANATDAASVITQFNALLASLRAAGILAT
jgi:hypothetical protein